MRDPNTEIVHILNIFLAASDKENQQQIPRLDTYPDELVSAVIQHISAARHSQRDQAAVFYDRLYSGIKELHKATKRSLFSYPDVNPEIVVLVAPQIKEHFRFSLSPATQPILGATEHFGFTLSEFQQAIIGNIEIGCDNLRKDLRQEFKKEFQINIENTLKTDRTIDTDHPAFKTSAYITANPEKFNELVSQYNAANVISSTIKDNSTTFQQKIDSFTDITQNKILPFAKNSRPARNFIEYIGRIITDIINNFRGLPKETTSADTFVQLQVKINQQTSTAPSPSISATTSRRNSNHSNNNVNVPPLAQKLQGPGGPGTSTGSN